VSTFIRKNTTPTANGQVGGPSIERAFNEAIAELATKKVNEAMNPVLKDPCFSAGILDGISMKLRQQSMALRQALDEPLFPRDFNPFQEAYKDHLMSQQRSVNGPLPVTATTPTEDARFTTKDYILLALGGLVAMNVATKIPGWLSALKTQFPVVYAALDARFGWLLPEWLKTEAQAKA